MKLLDVTSNSSEDKKAALYVVSRESAEQDSAPALISPMLGNM
jgi:hypothetical protein